ncbi:MAG: YggS family pyridoxal phosphate-dependent enzyme [Planctomycetia bacterium]|nr:YggS family pyridoxal phosphate-dependent enzyme [Planctomycetia bacterium]
MSESDNVLQRLQENAAVIEERIQQACLRARRPRHAVTVIPVTKYVDTAVIRKMQQLGFHAFGESRPQSLWEKAAAVPKASWHLIGHMQRNKVERTLPLVTLIHSVDSQRLLLAIEEEARKINRVQEVLLELHMTDEETKTGIAEKEWPSIPDWLAELHHVKVTGLMGMSALQSDDAHARKVFAKLRHQAETMQLPSPHELKHLSMGMTQDFEEAIQEGATLVRIGSAYFEGMPER